MIKKMSGLLIVLGLIIFALGLKAGGEFEVPEIEEYQCDCDWEEPVRKNLTRDQMERGEY